MGKKPKKWTKKKTWVRNWGISAENWEKLRPILISNLGG